MLLTLSSRELKQLPPDLHLLCPRSGVDDIDRYDEDIEGVKTTDISDPKRSIRIRNARDRRDKFISALQLLAYDGVESAQYQRYIWERIDEALGNCDICIRNYYVGRTHFLAKLREEYEEDDIKVFFDIIHRRDISRITDGLNGAKRTLQNVPEAKRGTSALEAKHLHAVFEALVCEHFLKDESLVAQHFDEPFRLLQTKKPLRIREILPATVRFLFSRSHLRLNWANSIWARIDRSPTPMEWNWAIKDYLQDTVRRSITPAELTRLWSGLKVIVDKLDSRTTAFQLLDLQPNVCFTALDHLNKPSSAIPFITQTLQMILSKAPDAFWQAMGVISPQTVIEQVFASPQFNNRLQESAKAADQRNLDILSWALPFVKALKLETRPTACQTLLTQLFNRIRNKEVSIEAKMLCFDVAAKNLRDVLVAFSDNEKNRESVGRLVLLDTLNLVSHRIDQFLNPGQFGLCQQIKPETRKTVLEIVKNSIALECQCLKSDFDTLNSDQPLRHESSGYSAEIWGTVLRCMNNDDFELSQHILLGLMQLPGLEQFRIVPWEKISRERKDILTREKHERILKDKKAFNPNFDKVTGAVAKVLEKITDFAPEHLDRLFKNQESSMSLVAALLSADQSTYEAAVNLIKNISGDFSRRDALSHLIEAFRNSTLYSLCWVLRRITNMRTFASVPQMIKHGMEILDVLCNQTSGQLRTTKNLEHREFGGIENYWGYQWAALTVVFQDMERWSTEFNDRDYLQEVCRDAMQYAEELFDQYDLFCDVLTTARPDKAAETRKGLLDQPAGRTRGAPTWVIDAMAKWLRLKDEYLVTTLVNLVTKMLYRIDKKEITAGIKGLEYIQSAAMTDKIRTNLTATQKATLIRALEHFHGEQLVKTSTKKKQSTLRDWRTSAADQLAGVSGSSSRAQSVNEYDDSEIDDDDLYEIANGIKSKPKDRPLPVQPKSITPKLPKKDSVLLKAREKQAQERLSFLETRKREQAAHKKMTEEASLKLRGKSGIGELTADQGSGLAGMGVQGKDHSEVRSALMVSSESESEVDSDEELFGIKTEPSTTSRVSGLKRPIPAGPVRKVKQVRSQKDMRARLAPDLSSLHKTILGWDFFASTELPPNSAKDDYTLVSSTFKTAAEYQKTFEPLLILEAWQSFRTAREDGTFKTFEFKVANSLMVDNFFEINVEMPLIQGQELGINTADVVLLSRAKRPDTSPDEHHCLARVKEVTRKKGQMQIVFRMNTASNTLRPYLGDKTTVYGVQILSLTPLEREYGALTALPYYDLCDEIVSAKPSPLLDYPDTDLRQFMNTYNVNKAQSKAIKSAIDNDAFTLIQGPPGSGKTKTICALVGAMMTGAANKPDSSGPRLNAVSVRAPVAFPASKKILVCAPSNAAVDELVMRFKQGVKMTNGSTEKLQVVRLGRSEAINAQVRDVTLEELVLAKLNLNGSKNGKEDIHAVMMEHQKASGAMVELRQQMDSIRAKGEQPPQTDQDAFEGYKRTKAALGSKIDRLKEEQDQASRQADLNRKRVQQEVLDSAHILCATLSGSGHDLFRELNVEFETVVIDEAAQSIELSALIPLKYGCSKCILVGDPKQLPPTVLSREAAKFQYEQSLFARMEHNHKKDIHLLDTQYRMHPEISLFPSKMFYDSRLRDGGDMAKLRQRPWHHSDVFAPYRFFDVQGMSESAPKGHSLINIAELNVAMQLYDRLTKDVPKYNFRGKIGIITPYKGQLKELRSRFRQRYGESILDSIEFNTTDAFQGRESEIIIFSCVRASTRGIGFLNDVRRMNVGLTRAKCSLWVLGNSQSLTQGEFWNALVKDAKSRRLYTDGDIRALLSQPLLTDDMMKDDVDMTGTDEYIATPESSSSSEAIAAAEPTSKPIPSKPPEPRITISSDSSRNPTPSISRPNSGMSGKSSSSSVNGTIRPAPQLKDVGRKPNTSTTPVGQAGADGPSGGRFGFNNLANCKICGSETHFSWNCDNAEARSAMMGNCHRCHKSGHVARACHAPRCLECGEVGHVSNQCDAPIRLRLTAEEKRDVERQEDRFSRVKQKAKEERLKRQMGEHGAGVPEVKTSLPSHTPVEPKRKRAEDEVNTNAMKTPRMDSNAPPPSGPRVMGGSGRPSMAPHAGTVRKKAADPSAMFVKRK